MPFLTESGTRSSSPACAIIASKPPRKQSQSRWWEITVPNISSPCVRASTHGDITASSSQSATMKCSGTLSNSLSKPTQNKSPCRAPEKSLPRRSIPATPNTTFAPSTIASSEWTSPRFQVSTLCGFIPCWPKSAPICPNFAAPQRLLHGWACARITASAVERYFPCAPATCRTAPHLRCASPPTRCIATSLFLAITTGACGPNSVPQKLLLQQPISWHASSTICSLLASPIRRASSPSAKLNINKEPSSLFTPGHAPSDINSSP